MDKQYTLGLIGAGNMGGALVKGMMASGKLPETNVLVFDLAAEKLAAMQEAFPGITLCASVGELAEKADIVLLAVKPNVLGAVAAEIRPLLTAEKTVVSIAAGWNMQKLTDALGETAPILRLMPNTPALVNASMTAICAENHLDADVFAYVQNLLQAVGRTVVLPEKLFDAVIAISGSSPAYVYMFIEAMADAGVQEGLPRPLAYEMAAQAVLGSAQMVLETKQHPGKLKDDVCSPGGTTIDAVVALERSGFRAAVMDAMAACAEKSRKMQK